MINKKVYNFSLALSLLCLPVLGILFFTNKLNFAGPIAISFFTLMALGSRNNDYLKQFTYTIIIFAAVTTSLFYPEYFLTWNGFKLTNLITPLIQIIMFGMGVSMSFKDFQTVVKSPKGVFIGVSSQFIIMPLLGFILASISGFGPEIAAGIVLIGCSPSGLASNVMSYLAKANLALSITITSITTLMAPFITPLLMKLLAGEMVDIQIVNMMWDISKMILVPIGVGLVMNKLLENKASWLNERMPFVSMFGIALIIVIITAAGRDSLLAIGPYLILLMLIHNLAGYFLGYWSARLFKLPESDCRTVAIEVGMQNGGLASGIAKGMGKIATVGLAAAIFGPLMNITGSVISSYWSKKEPIKY